MTDREDEALAEAIRRMAEQAYARGLAEGQLTGMTLRHARLRAALVEIAGPPYPTASRAVRAARAALKADGDEP